YTVQTNTGTLSANTGTGGNVVINNTSTGSLDLKSSSAGGRFDLTTNRDITLKSGAGYGLTATDVFVTTSANNGNIVINSNPTASNSITFYANGSGAISGLATIAANTVSLKSDTGNIGTASGGSPYTVQTNTGTL